MKEPSSDDCFSYCYSNVTYRVSGEGSWNTLDFDAVNAFEKGSVRVWRNFMILPVLLSPLAVLAYGWLGAFGFFVAAVAAAQLTGIKKGGITAHLKKGSRTVEIVCLRDQNAVEKIYTDINRVLANCAASEVKALGTMTVSAQVMEDLRQRFGFWRTLFKASLKVIAATLLTLIVAVSSDTLESFQSWAVKVVNVKFGDPVRWVYKHLGEPINWGFFGAILLIASLVVCVIARIKISGLKKHPDYRFIAHRPLSTFWVNAMGLLISVPFGIYSTLLLLSFSLYLAILVYSVVFIVGFLLNIVGGSSSKTEVIYVDRN